MVMAHSLFRDLHARDPATVIDVLAPPWSLGLLDRMAEVRRGIALPVAHGELALGKRYAAARALAMEQYDQAIVLPRSMKAALVPLFARIRQRTGFRGEFRYGAINDVRVFDRKVLDQTVKRFRALGLDRGSDTLPPLREPALQVDAVARSALVETFALALDRPIVALMPGAEYGPAKQWPADCFGELAGRLVDTGFRVWIFGGAGEAELGAAIAADRSGVVNLCGRTSLTDAIDLLSLARFAVSNDSGLMHVAAAVGVHVIGIYGSSSPGFTPPLTRDSTIVYRALSCSPCFARQCPLGHTDCLRGIGVSEIAAIIGECPQ
jgi:heptosyltransferase-2